MAQRQFYFVDACRVRPEAAIALPDARHRGRAARTRSRARARCSVVYFSGHAEHGGARRSRAKGTLFVQALLDCLDTALGVDDHAHEDGTWAVTTATLMQALPRRACASWRRPRRRAVRRRRAASSRRSSSTCSEERRRCRSRSHSSPRTRRLRARAPLGRRRTSTSSKARRSTPTIAAAEAVPAGKYLLSITIEPPTPPFANVDVTARPRAAALVHDDGEGHMSRPARAR